MGEGEGELGGGREGGGMREEGIENNNLPLISSRSRRIG